MVTSLQKYLTEKKRKAKENTIPQITESLKTGVNYNVVLSDGRSFKNVEIIGTVENDDEQFSFANWEGMLVLKQENENRIFIKKNLSSVCRRIMRKLIVLKRSLY